MSSNRYREITVAGSPREMGRQIGETAREEVRGFCAMAMEHVQRTVAISPDAARDVAETCLPLAEQYSPDSVEELRGIAEAADVPLIDVMLLQVRNQLRPEEDSGCTSFSLRPPGYAAMIGQNWDSDPALDQFTVMLTRRPTGKPALMTITQAGLIAYIGMNDAGIAACLNTLPAPSRRTGVPHYFTLRGIYEADSLEGAVHAVSRAQRAIPASIMLGTPQGPANLEVTIDDVKVLRPASGESSGVTHTNHCLHPELVAINEDFPELIQSHPRKQRIDELLLNNPSAAGDRTAIEAALRDHRDHPRSICRHVNDDPGEGFWQTVFSVIIEPEAARMYVTRGTPCDHPYEEYVLN